jgi:hypothetical protein
MVPSADEWTLVVNKRTGVFHTFYPVRDDLGRVPLEKRSVSPPVEQLTFTIPKNPAGKGGSITMSWETTEVSAPFTVVQ